MRHLTLFNFLFVFYSAIGQILPSERRVDWSVAGIRDSSTQNMIVLDALSNGFSADGNTPNDLAFSDLMMDHPEPFILYFSTGTFLFNQPLVLRSNMVLRGSGASNTTLKIDHGGSGHGILISGSSIPTDTCSLSENWTKDSTNMQVVSTSLFQGGDWIHLSMNDADLITSSWALGSVGQIAQINSINGNLLTLQSAARLDFPISRSPKIKKINPIENVGIECLKIDRIDNCAPEQASNVYLNYAVNCWINGVESNQTTFAHVEANHSSNCSVTNSYFHDAFDYGGGGRAYGVMFHFSTNECLVYSNVFDHLRHSMILQAGANGNVFAYNRSVDPFWTGSAFLPANSAGDMVLHGNYVFSNLFEQNDGQNMVIDNSHGGNGPNNTFFRNRGSLYGIFFSDNTSPNQNFIGNEIPNTSFPYSTVNYNLLGTNHFVYGNNNKGTIDPAGTSDLSDSTYFFSQPPNEILNQYYASIGVPNAMNSGIIPATYYLSNNQLFANACGYTTDLGTNNLTNETDLQIYPNPAVDAVQVASENLNVRSIRVFNILGLEVIAEKNPIFPLKLDLSRLEKGCYVMYFETSSGNYCKKLNVLRP
jgi:hypothetical protein